MALCCKAIRQQMTGLWAGAKMEAKTEKKALTEKYERKLSVMTQAVGTLEANLSEAREAGQTLSVVLWDIEKSKDAAHEETRMVETP